MVSLSRRGERGQRQYSEEHLASRPGVEELVVDVAVGFELPVGGGPRRVKLHRTEPVSHPADVLIRVGEAQTAVDPLAGLIVPIEHLDDGRRRHPKVDLDSVTVGRIRVDPSLAAHEAQRRDIDVLSAGHHAVADIEGQRRGRGVGIEADRLGIELEVAVALHAADPVTGIGVEQVERTRPGELRIGAAAVALAPAVPGGLPSSPLVRFAVCDRLLRLHADAVQTHTGARALLVGGADAVVVVHDHLGFGLGAGGNEGENDQDAMHGFLTGNLRPLRPTDSVSLGKVGVDKGIKCSKRTDYITLKITICQGYI